MRVPLALGFVLAAAALAASAPESSDQTKVEKQNLTKISEEWTVLGKWAVEKKLLAGAKLCLERAEAADAGYYGIKPFKDKVSSCEDAASAADSKEWDKKLAATGKKIASLYDKILATAPGETDPKVLERFEGYTFTALGLDADAKRWQALLAEAEAALGQKGKDAAKENARGMRLLDKATALKPPEKVLPQIRRLVDVAATGRLVLKTASTHPLKYYFQLPPGYERKKDKKWPILVCVDGAGSNFYGIATNYVNKTFIVISPCTFWNTNGVDGNEGMMKKYRDWYTDEVIKKADADRANWDEEGILVAIKDVQQGFDGEGRVYFTGFSGGGNSTYMMIFKHPDLLNGAAPTCANFGGGYSQMKDKFSADDLNFPVHQITGEKDEYRETVNGAPGINSQTAAAFQCMKDLAYPNVKQTVVPGMGHSGATEQVLATFKPYMDGSKKRSDKQ